MADIQEKKSGAINGRISAELRFRLDEVSRRWGPNDATMLSDALSALCDYVEAAGKYQRPMKMVFDEDADAHHRLLVAEAGPAATAAASATVQQLRKEEQARAARRPAARK